MRRCLPATGVALSVVLTSRCAFAAPVALPDLTSHPVGIASLVLFVLAYLLVATEELTHLHKSKPVLIAAGLMWGGIALVASERGFAPEVETAFRMTFLEYAEVLLFLIVAMTYIAALQERGVFDALRAWLVRSRFSYRTLFWLTGSLAFVISPVADNMTTSLLMGAVAVAVGKSAPRFVALSCIGIVVGANAGGAFSPFGDITTLMVWQKGNVTFGEFFALLLPSIVNFVVPAAIMHFAVPAGRPEERRDQATLKPGALTVIALFGMTIVLAVTGHNMLDLPPVAGMMTGLGLLQLFSYAQQQRRRGRNDEKQAFDVFARMAGLEWDTLLFFYGVLMCVGALGAIGYLTLGSHLLYGGAGATAANVLIGILSAILDNIPLMYAVLTMQPDMSLGQWQLITLTVGVGGSLLSVGSAAGVALMGQARGAYTFSSHLKWTPAVAVGYAASVLLHRVMNAANF